MRRQTPLRILVLKKIHSAKMVIETYSSESSSSEDSMSDVDYNNSNLVIQVKPRKRKYESTYNENEPFEEDLSKDTVNGRVTKKQRMLSEQIEYICTKFEDHHVGDEQPVNIVH